MKHGTLLLYNFKSDVSRIINLSSVCTETHTRNPKNNKKKTKQKEQSKTKQEQRQNTKAKTKQNKISIEKL